MKFIENLEFYDVQYLSVFVVDDFMINVETQRAIQKIKIEILDLLFLNFIVDEIILKDDILILASHEAIFWAKRRDVVAHNDIERRHRSVSFRFHANTKVSQKRDKLKIKDYDKV